MPASHVADDYAAIARRLKEIQEKGKRAEERRPRPLRPVDISYHLDRTRRQEDPAVRPYQ